jgi:hypothetical protein
MIPETRQTVQKWHLDAEAMRMWVYKLRRHPEECDKNIARKEIINDRG